MSMKQTKHAPRPAAKKKLFPCKPAAVLPAFFVLFLLSSCFGFNAGIVLNQNGSGTLALEYRVSKSLDSLGKQDGNERWNTIPVGKADFERTLERLPEMKLISFSSTEDEKDIVIAAKMEFASIEGLLSFLDASGRRSSFSGDSRQGRLVLTLNEGGGNSGNDSINQLLAAVFESYSAKMSMTFPNEGSLAVLDNQGKALATVPGGKIQASGKMVSFDFPLYEIVSSPGGIMVEFRW